MVLSEDAINAIQIILIYHVTPVRTGRITLHPESKQKLFTVDIPTLEADSQNISMFELRWRKVKNTTTLHTGTINQNVKRDIILQPTKPFSFIK